MHIAVKYFAVGSALALAGIISVGSAGAAQKMNSGMQPDSGMQQESCPDGQNCMPDDMNGPPPPPPNGSQGNKKKMPPQNSGEGNNMPGQGGYQGNGQANGNWHYNPDKHHRSKHHDSRYRYFYGGYWYLEPYWTFPAYGYNRIDCDEGRDIVDGSGFYRVRPIDCSGRTYAYLGKRHGNTFRIVLNSRTGRIIDVSPF